MTPWACRFDAPHGVVSPPVRSGPCRSGACVPTGSARDRKHGSRALSANGAEGPRARGARRRVQALRGESQPGPTDRSWRTPTPSPPDRSQASANSAGSSSETQILSSTMPRSPDRGAGENVSAGGAMAPTTGNFPSGRPDGGTKIVAGAARLPDAGFNILNSL
jgi:hypothetical protein